MESKVCGWPGEMSSFAEPLEAKSADALPGGKEEVASVGKNGNGFRRMTISP